MTDVTRFKTIREIHDAFDAKTLSPTDLTKAYLAAAKKSASLNAYLLLCEERALGQAREAESVLSREGKVPRDRLPLLGIPLALKDLLCVEGMATTCASKILENYCPPYTATAVERLEHAGAVVLGKTNMDEFAMGGSNENSAFGPVKHPRFPDRVPGGSSGGSAAAVGASLCTAALGTDTGGSIRLPAHYCGIVGLKPTYGRVSRNGLVAFASSLDQIGPMTRSVEDAAVLLNVIAGPDSMDSTCSPRAKPDFTAEARRKPDWSKLRIGVPREYFTGGLQPEVEKAVEASLKWFEAQGAKRVPVSLLHSHLAVAVYYIVAVCEASSNLSRFDGVKFGVRPPAADQAADLATFYRKTRALFGPEVKRRIILGTFALSSGYADAYYKRACQVRRLIQQDFARAFESCDLIAGPVSATTAYRIGEKARDPLQMYLNDLYTIPANLAGLPAISFPCGEDGQGLPIGMHLHGQLFDEGTLLSVANAFEKGRA